MKDISIVIVLYNAKDVTIKMLRSLEEALEECKKENITCETVAVDNGSTDGVSDEVEKNFKWLKLLRGENVGFSEGNNRGIQKASNSKYMLFLNPDIVLDKNTIVEMFKYMEKDKNGDIGLSTCQVDLWSGGLDWDSHRGFPTPWRAMCYFIGLEKLAKLSGIKPLMALFGGYHLLGEDFNRIHQIDVCLGAFMLVRREVGESINWWPTDYFLNGEDVDFCYQIKEIKHKKIMYAPITKIVHFKGASKGTKSASSKITKATKEQKTVSINSGIAAMKIFYDKYYVNKYPYLLTKLIHLGIQLLHLKRLITKRE